MDDRTAAPTLLTASLWIWLVDAFVWGALILFAPGFVVETVAGDTAFNYGWMRWSGGILIGLAVGTWMVLREPRGNGVFVLASGLAAFTPGLGVIFSFVTGEYGGDTWFLWLTLAASLGVGALLLYAWSTSRDVLD